MPWFKDEVFKDSTTLETLTWLAAGLKFDVISCTTYEVNNCIFYTKFMDEKSIVQNSSVTLEAESMQFSTLKGTNQWHTMGLYKIYGRLTTLSFSFQFSSVNGLTIKVGLKLMNQDSL